MDLLNNVNIESIKDDMYLFLNKYNRKWLNSYFKSKYEFEEYILDDDVNSIIFTNAEKNICCIGILEENIVVTVCFDNNTKNNESFGKLFNTLEKIVKEEGYSEIYFGESEFSFGLFEPDNEYLVNYLEAAGYKTQSVNYDVKYSVDSLGKLINSSLFDIKKFNMSELKEIYNNDEKYRKELSTILAYFIRYQDDECFLALSKNEKIIGYAFLDNNSNTIDRIDINEKSVQTRLECEKELLVGIAKYLKEKNKDYLIREYVDQLKTQSISSDFEVCGKYKNVSRGIK